MYYGFLVRDVYLQLLEHRNNAELYNDHVDSWYIMFMSSLVVCLSVLYMSIVVLNMSKEKKLNDRILCIVTFAVCYSATSWPDMVALRFQ